MRPGGALDQWRPTAALSRTLLVGAVGVAGGVLLGRPALLVLVAPLVVHAVLALRARPTRSPSVRTTLDHRSLHEGQGTISRVELSDAQDVEQITRVGALAPYVISNPPAGRISRMRSSGLPDLSISPRRWGRRSIGLEKIALTTGWAGYRFGPVSVNATEMRILPATEPYDSRAENPKPMGLVGEHRSSRAGSGTEFAGIRAFEVGDRLRRINWRVSTRTGNLHVTTSRAEQDSGVLLVVDALGDHGASDGIDGRASSLDLTMRAAAALARHTVARGDRIGLRVVGADSTQIAFGAGEMHLRRILAALGAVVPADLHGHGDRLRLRVNEGTTVIVLSPVLAEQIGTAAAATVRRGLPTLVIDTLPPEASPSTVDDDEPRFTELAWRMRKAERKQVLAGLERIGCPVVAWRGPGTLDDVLWRLARRAEQPRMRIR